MKHSTLAFLALSVVGLAVSCSSDSPVELPIRPPEVPAEMAEPEKAPKLKSDDDVLSTEDMLADPLFHALVLEIDQPTLSGPLLAAVDALGSGQTAKAKNLLSAASAAADALEDDPASAEARIFWSAIEQFLNEAELI